ncbi:MAG: DUF4352 domain-containing protein [Candidatus Dormibacteraeota bacterium]|uniref:DUF4352 domain-containing protein n=1 Tax=Candidatus Amunia macphersoniae TaxID=3127014 RepID=A0A934KJM4_9BACT|nr:DUF4352 domain-containing protein [Candidatus Dormibacteraeota bacterium]
MTDIPPPPSPPEQPASAALRKSHLWRNLGIGAGAAIAIAVLVTILVARQAGIAQPGNQNCSPPPCGDDGSGFQIHVDAINRNLPPDTFAQPEAGNHFVQVTVRLTNNANGPRDADTNQLLLQDSAGVRRSATLSFGSQCAAFDSVTLAKGSSLGPKLICFDAGGDVNGKLSLIWTPGSHDIDIDLANASPAATP